MQYGAKMRIHYFQHVPFEGLGSIQRWAKSNFYPLTATCFHLNDGLPRFEDFDWLIVMGGPMSVNDEGKYAWLAGEKHFIESAIERNKVVLGICLGAQLIANVLGSRIYKNVEKEIGWHPVRKTEKAKQGRVLNMLPREFVAFHWHGETFDLPAGALHIASSEACPNQAFVFDTKVIGLQFHLESTPESVRALLDHCPEDIVAARYVQSPEQMLENKAGFSSTNQIMRAILDGLHNRLDDEGSV
jgi:GMP synthase-like glutamine amidotransferase